MNAKGKGLIDMEDVLVIEVKYHVDELIRIDKISVGDWIDLRAAENVELKEGENRLISLGVSMKLPEGYEVNIVPRSSTLKNFGVLQGNSFGVVDNSYCGNEDIYKFPAYAVRDTRIELNDRICQFRLNKIQPKLIIKEVDKLDGKNRGGFGSTGKN